MAYCPKCGVEVSSKKCPLCSYVIKQDIHTIPFSHSVEIDRKKIYLTLNQKKSIYNASTTFFAILISSICLATDYFIDNKISWAIYPIISTFTMALITWAAIYVKGKIKVIFILIFFLLMLFILDIYIPVTNFFLMISLPISIMTSIISFCVVILIKKSANKGTNIPGFILLGIILITISIDLIIQNFIGNELKITWSLITTVSILPVALFLLYLDRVLSKRVDLKKVFHT